MISKIVVVERERMKEGEAAEAAKNLFKGIYIIQTAAAGVGLGDYCCCEGLGMDFLVF
jgi:hypothetical protein